MEFLKGFYAVAILAAITATVALLEAWRPWRRQGPFSLARWLRAGAVSAYGAILIAVIPLISSYSAATAAENLGFGLLNAAAPPLWIQVVIAILFFDLAAFFLHVMFHRWGFLWRVHRLHHSDSRVDAATSLRFHPLEVLVRVGAEAPLVFVLGLPPEGALIAYPLLVAINAYTHANVALPQEVERRLSPVLVTPRMHRLHHTSSEANQRTNYGTTLALWDRMLGTWRGPAAIGEGDRFGLEGPEALPRESFAAMLMDPFRGRGRGAPAAAGEPLARSDGQPAAS